MSLTPSPQATERADKRLTQQRELSIKGEMNHEEKFREFYTRRLKQNTAHSRAALPDEIPEYRRLLQFDHARIGVLTEKLRQNQEALNQTEN